MPPTSAKVNAGKRAAALALILPIVLSMTQTVVDYRNGTAGTTLLSVNGNPLQNDAATAAAALGTGDAALRAQAGRFEPGAWQNANSSWFYGVSLETSSDMWVARPSALTPLAVLFMRKATALVRRDTPNAEARTTAEVAKFLTELTGGRLVDGLRAWLCDEHAPAYRALYNHGFLNALVLGAAVKALWEAGMTSGAHLEALLDVALPFAAPATSPTAAVLPNGGQGVGPTRGAPGELVRRPGLRAAWGVHPVRGVPVDPDA